MPKIVYALHGATKASKNRRAITKFIYEGKQLMYFNYAYIPDDLIIDCHCDKQMEYTFQFYRR